MPSNHGEASWWRWEDPTWESRVGTSEQNLILEALRRAVDIRDRKAEQVGLSKRPVMLVDVLNALARSVGVDTGQLWESP
jgi:hypothetical protein